MRATTRAISTAFTALTITACGGGSGAPALVHVHGTFAQGLGSNCQVSGGDQVTITGPDGKVLAAPSLAMTPVTKKYHVSGVTVPEQTYPFSATVPPEPRYGITAEGNPPYYVTEQQFGKGIDLSC